VPDWNEVLREIQEHKLESPLDAVRRQYLKKFSEKTGRNVIAYYSGWLKDARPSPALVINDEDKNAFMATVHELERDKGLDLILHTPGGDLAAAESLVDYLRQMFGTNIRAIIPQLAMSAGTMIACACKKIIMGKQSNLGPIDPQFNGVPANGVIAEFNQAIREIKKDPETTPLWQVIIGKYHPSFLGSCQHAIQWSKEIVEEWLKTGMFEGESADDTIKKIIEGLSDSETTYNHARHIHVETLEELGLKIEKMEEDDDLQDLILTVHHTYMHTFAMSPALKIVENQKGSAMIRMGEKP